MHDDILMEDHLLVGEIIPNLTNPLFDATYRKFPFDYNRQFVTEEYWEISSYFREVIPTRFLIEFDYDV